MNERIRELAKQAYSNVITNTPSFLVTREMYEEKFAELIVKECADLIDSKRELGLDPNGEYLKQHFGVN